MQRTLSVAHHAVQMEIEAAQQQGAGAESTMLGQLIEIYRQNRRNTLQAVGDALFGALK